MGVINESLEMVPFFKGLLPSEVEILADWVETRRVPADEMIITQDMPGGTLYFLLEGKVSVYSLVGKNQKQIIKVLSQGESFGLFSFLDGEKHSANVKTETDCRLLFLKKSDFDALAEKNPELCTKVLKKLMLILCSYMRQMDNSFIDMVRYVVSDR
ncbi:MAG: Crp/Fnr family transcriptional regulator [bacterium]